MLCLVLWEPIDDSEAGQRRSLAVFAQWEPPKGFDIQGFWGFADGSGGAAVVEIDSSETIAKATGPFTPWLRFTVKPILNIQDAAILEHEAVAFRESVG